MNKAVPICILVVIGALSLCALPGMTASAQSADPTAMGPLTVESEVYTLGDRAFTELPMPAEVTGVVYYPTNWIGGPLPLILFIHGRHQTCFAGQTASFNWPCDPNEIMIPNFRGYDYIAKVLASNGYYVVSISANGVSAQEPASRGVDTDIAFDGTEARAKLIKRHLDLWNTYNTENNERFGTRFINKIDMQRIGLIGHSKGGESVIKYFKNYPSPLPYSIKAIFVISPTDIPKPDAEHPDGPRKRLKINNVAFAVLLPYCDGDVKNLEGVHFFDDSRYNLSEEPIKDTAPKHTILVMGANHNYFNTVWTGPAQCDPPAPMLPSSEFIYPGACDDSKASDPFCKHDSSERLPDYKQRTIAIAYVCAFMRAYVGGESQFMPLLTNQAPPPPSMGANNVYVSFHPPDNYFSRLDVNRLVEENNLSTNTLGGIVTKTSLPGYVLCGGTSRCLNSNLSSDSEPHIVIQDRDKDTPVEPGLKQLKLGWMVKPGSLTNQIPPAYRNISGYQALQFRASVSFGPDSPNMPSAPLDFRVTLKDGTGAAASIRVSDFSSALFHPPGTMASPQRAILNTVRLPLSAFARLNLTDIRSVEFKFDQPMQGELLITDIAFSSVAHILLPVFSTDACLKDDSSGAELRFNTATGNYVFCCAGGMTTSGVGKVVTQGNVVSLVQGSNETDRRLVATLDRSTKRGTASLQSPAGSLICSITDRNTANNTCSCAPAP